MEASWHHSNWLQTFEPFHLSARINKNKNKENKSLIDEFTHNDNVI